MKRILIIEDNKSIRDTLVLALEFDNYQVQTASNGSEALTLLENSTELPHIIILDMQMPVMNGYEFRKEQMKRSKISQIPVIILTANNNLQDLKKELQAYEFLNKPVEVQDLYFILETFFYLLRKNKLTSASQI